MHDLYARRLSTVRFILILVIIWAINFFQTRNSVSQNRQACYGGSIVRVNLSNAFRVVYTADRLASQIKPTTPQSRIRWVEAQKLNTAITTIDQHIDPRKIYKLKDPIDQEIARASDFSCSAEYPNPSPLP